MYCKKCGNLIEKESGFCNGCGAPIKTGNETVLIDEQTNSENDKTESLVGVTAADNAVSAVPFDGFEPLPNLNGLSALKMKQKNKLLKLPIIITIVLIFIIGGSAATWFGVSALNTKKYDEMIDTGNKYLEEQKYEEAVEVFLEAIDVKPKREEAYVGAATGYIELGEPEKAKDILEKGLENLKEPGGDFLGLCDELGVIYERQENAISSVAEESVAASETTTGPPAATEQENTTAPQSTQQNSTTTRVSTQQNNSTAPVSTQQVETTVPASIKTGDIIYFGRYEQDNNLANGKEKIAWRVLTVANRKAFLLADKILDAKPYNVEQEYSTWETCTLRKWLNDEFWIAAFNSSEKAKILTRDVVNEDNPEYGAPGGKSTKDKIFLLSYSEATNRAYGFNSDADYEDPYRQAPGSDFAKNNGLWVSEYSIIDNSYWWLRTPGDYQGSACDVSHDGSVAISYGVSGAGIGVRPALWINL